MSGRSMYTVRYARVNALADGDNTVIAGVADKRITVLGYLLTTDVGGSAAAGEVTLQDTAAAPGIVASLQFSSATGGGAAFVGSAECPAFELPIGLGLEINNPVGVDTTGHLTYVLTSA